MVTLNKKKKILCISAIILTLIILSLTILNRWERFLDTANTQNSITQRLSYWRTAGAMIKDYAFLGTGPGNFKELFLKYRIGIGTNTRYAHNIFLHTLAETGILGLIALLYIIIDFFRKFNLQSKHKFIFLGILSFLLHNLIDNTYFIPEAGFFFWILLGLI